MSLITDDELISFCDFTNLHIEWANIGRRVEKDGTITAYHTIYSFLEVDIMVLLKEKKMDLIKKLKYIFL